MALSALETPLHCFETTNAMLLLFAEFTLRLGSILALHICTCNIVYGGRNTKLMKMPVSIYGDCFLLTVLHCTTLTRSSFSNAIFSSMFSFFSRYSKYSSSRSLSSCGGTNIGHMTGLIIKIGAYSLLSRSSHVMTLLWGFAETQPSLNAAFWHHQDCLL